MENNLKDALAYVAGLKTEALLMRVDHEGRTYLNTTLQPLKDPGPRQINMATLESMVDYINFNPDKHELDTLFIHVVSPYMVHLMRQMSGAWNQGPIVADVKYESPTVRFFNKYSDHDQFVVALQTLFQHTENRQELAKIIGNVTDQEINTVEDDGVSQQVTTRKGIAQVVAAVAPNPVTLKPLRTFPEIEQPTSPFIFRLRPGQEFLPQCALYECDNGMWKLDAIKSLRKYFIEAFTSLSIKVPVIA